MTSKWKPIAGVVTLCALAGAVFAQGVSPRMAGYQKNRPRNQAYNTYKKIPWSQASGRPNITPGQGVGGYIWHEGNQVFIATTSTRNKGRDFKGHVYVVGGTLSSPRGLQLEHEDKIKQTKPNELYFNFKVRETVDGIQFAVSGGQHIAISLRIQGQPIKNLYFGSSALPTHQDPARFDLSH